MNLSPKNDPYLQNHFHEPENVPTNETWTSKVEALALNEQDTLLWHVLPALFLTAVVAEPSANIGGFTDSSSLALLSPRTAYPNNEVWGVQWL